MKKNFQLTSSALVLVGFLSLFSSYCPLSSLEAQEVPGIELPEYYGLYAVVEGKLYGIGISVSSFSPPLKRAALLTELRAGDLSTAQVLELPGNVEFLVFYQSEGLASSMEVAFTLDLKSYPFIRQCVDQFGGEPFRANAWYVGGGRSVFLMSAVYEHFKEIELLLKPLPGHPDITLARPASALRPGLYRLSSQFMEDYFVFVVPPISEAEHSRCIDILPAGDHHLAVAPCGEALRTLPSEATTVSESPPIPSPVAAKEVGCSTYRSCLVAAHYSLRGGRFVQALAEAEKAKTLDPSQARAWGLLGDVHLSLGKTADATRLWDKFLQLGGETRQPVWREKRLTGDRGALKLSTERVSFVTRDGETIFDTETGEVESTESKGAKALFGPLADPDAIPKMGILVLEIRGKKYKLDPIPLGTEDCGIQGSQLVCPEPSASHQVAIADYLAKTIRELADGSSPVLERVDETSGMSAEEKQKWLNFIGTHSKAVLNIPEPKDNWLKIMFADISGKWDSYQSLYLSGVNRRNLAADALASARIFLESGDSEETSKYANLSVKYFDQSNQLFEAAEIAYARGIESVALKVEVVYEVSSLIAKYGLAVTSACGPTCYDLVEWAVLLSNHGVDRAMRGKEEAVKQITSAALAKVLLDSAEVSALMENLSQQLLAVSGADRLVQQALASPEFLEAAQKALEEAGEVVSKDVLADAITQIREVASDGFNVSPPN